MRDDEGAHRSTTLPLAQHKWELRPDTELEGWCALSTMGTSVCDGAPWPVGTLILVVFCSHKCRHAVLVHWSMEHRSLWNGLDTFEPAQGASAGTLLACALLVAIGWAGVALVGCATALAPTAQCLCHVAVCDALHLVCEQLIQTVREPCGMYAGACCMAENAQSPLRPTHTA